LEPAFRAADTYTVDADICQAAALHYWCGPGHETFAALEDGAMVGTYYLRANQGGGGAHVANCGFVTAPRAQGRGVARAMLEHALERARLRGFKAMQFNFVVSSNARAVATWAAYGFEVVGRLPLAFKHPTQGYVDALVMYRAL
jgi:GNAT superfamily N-acetyltransferase